jgi:hypothetical protein
MRSRVVRTRPGWRKSLSLLVLSQSLVILIGFSVSHEVDAFDSSVVGMSVGRGKGVFDGPRDAEILESVGHELAAKVGMDALDLDVVAISWTWDLKQW